MQNGSDELGIIFNKERQHYTYTMHMYGQFKNELIMENNKQYMHFRESELK